MQAKVISIPDGTNVTDGSTKFKGVAGAAEELKFTYVNNKTNKPIKKNFSGTKTTYTFLNGHIQVNTKETTSKVAITRGLYGTYLGVYNNNLIHDNSLINIYIPGYGTENISEYFNIRINCED
jgi:tRNA G18 (ribose-2'-O)-methylase SpoU